MIKGKLLCQCGPVNPWQFHYCYSDARVEVDMSNIDNGVLRNNNLSEKSSPRSQVQVQVAL